MSQGFVQRPVVEGRFRVRLQVWQYGMLSVLQHLEVSSVRSRSRILDIEEAVGCIFLKL